MTDSGNTGATENTSGAGIVQELTAAQQGIWFAQKIDPGNPGWNIAEYAVIRGAVDHEVLRAAVRHVAGETDALRLVFGEWDGVPYQRVGAESALDVDLVDLSAEPEPEREAQRRMAADLGRPADTSTGPLIRLTLYRLADRLFFFHQQVHHLALDGYSAALALARIADVYTRLAADGGEPVPVEPRPLTPLLTEERDYLASEQCAADREFWSTYLDGAPAPAGFEEGAPTAAHGFVAVGRTLDAERTARLRSAARSAGVAWPVFFMAATAVYLHRSRGLGEVVLGLPVTGRRTELARSTPGMLSGVLPVRLTVSPSDRVADVAKRASAAARKVLRHQRYPTERIRRDQGLTSPADRLTGPAVNVMAFDDTLRFGPHTATLHNLSVGPVDDLVVAVHGSFTDGGLRIDVLGNPAVHTRASLEGHHTRLLRLLSAFASDPGLRVGALRTTAEGEHLRLLELGRSERASEGSGAFATLSEEFSAQAARTPELTAVVAGGASLTFRQLEDRVAALASVLADTGAGPGTRVAVGLPRSVDLVVAMLAVLRAGAAYVPLDPGYPTERLVHMLDDARPTVLTATPETARRVDPDGSVPLVTADRRPSPGAVPTAPPHPSAHDPAYVIYTSGSTGRPKGVVVEHRSLSNLLAHHRAEAYTQAERVFGRRLRVALTAAASFDASWDPVLWMVAGHELHLVDEATRRDPQALAAFLAAERIDAVETTPSFLRQLMSAGLLDPGSAGPRVVALGGEAVDEALWEELTGRSDLLVFNFYGPTEATVNAVTARVQGTAPSIGRPVAGALAYVLDSGLHPLPVGVAGELYLGGAGVARGYAGQSGLTADRFLPDPFAAPGSRMYRTGDLARWSTEGTLEFLGRSDQQVKIRGFRVETGEIESALRALPGVGDAAVVAAPGDGGERLAAYVVPAGGRYVELAEARESLGRMLPEHLVPALWAAVERLPLTANGKLDAAGLPPARPVGAGAGGEPRTPEERAVCELFAVVLDVPHVGREDDFFALGGHSLLATRLVSRARRRFGVDLSIGALFDAPTPAAVARLLASAERASTPSARPRPRPGRLPLSHAQERLWMLERLGEGGTAYHLPLALRLRGDLDAAALSAALTDLVHQHESLRTLIKEDAQGAFQVILPPQEARIGLEVTDHPADGPAVPRPRVPEFALDRDLPLHGQLLRTGPEEALLVLTLHHIAVDGWSLAPLLRDLSAAYSARRTGSVPAWKPLPLQYADYALWQREALGATTTPGSLAHTQLAHWREALRGLPAEVTLPADRRRTAHRSGRGGATGVRVEAAVHRLLTEIAAECGVSSFMVLHGALAALMSRLGAGEDIVVGTPVAGRTEEEFTDLVGFFVNTLVLRTDTSGAPGFRELLHRVRAGDLEAYAHQELPFERLVEELNPPRTPARHPLFQVMLSLNNTPAPQLALSGLDVRHDPSFGRPGAKFDLTWDLAEHFGADGAPAGIDGVLEFSEDLFDEATAQGFAAHFTRLLTALLDAPDRPFTDIAFLTGSQRDTALGEPPYPAQSSGATSGDGRSATLLDVLATRAIVTPDRVAVVDADGPLAFHELHRRVEDFARLLRAAGVAHGDRVAVALPRTAGYVVALLGVLRAGAVHVPLDPQGPRDRNRLIVETARPALLVTTSALSHRLPPVEDRALLLVDSTAALGRPGSPSPLPPRPCDAAYVLYTSGSTGRPKGVVVEHHALTNLLATHQERLIGPAEHAVGGAPLRVALTAAMTFDASWDPLLWMVAGHELHLVDDATRTDPERLTAYLREHAVDVIETTPSFLEQLRSCGLFDRAQAHPRLVALGGEAVNEGLWTALSELEGVEAWNLYGPTEATVDALVAPLTPGTAPHLGDPVAGTRARVLDSRFQPVAPGVVGELYLSGPGLARGYERQGPATADRFLPDPWGPVGSRMYRTGDLVRRRGGRLEYVGRADGQVKVRGFRVETGEVEAVLARHPSVAGAAVTVREDDTGTARLLAWAVNREGQPLASSDLRSFARERLPAYMVPARLSVVDALPLTAHGKTDFAALTVSDPPDTEERAAPRTPQEEILCALFAEALDLDRIGRDDDFFDAGGHSLLATRVIGRIRSAFGAELPVRALFEAPTPALLAERLRDAAAARPALRRAVRPDPLPLSYAQQRLWFLHRMNPEDASYHLPVVIRLDGALDRAALRGALADVVERHESLRTVFRDGSEGPVQIVLGAGDAAVELPETATAEHGLATALRAAAAEPFDLSRQPPLRARLFTLDAHRHALLVTVHHIAADGWSMGPLAQDLAGAYAARAGGSAPRRRALPVQYADYTLWQRALLGGTGAPEELAVRQLDYWKAQLAGAPEETALPADRARPTVPSGEGGLVGLRLGPEATAAVADLARASGSSVFMVLHASLTALLHRLGGDEDLTVGTPIAGRTDEALDGLVGFFVNTLALRVRATGDLTFRELLGRARETDLAAYAHQDIPFERLVEEVRPARSLGRHPLFQVMLTLDNTPPPSLRLPGLEARMEPVATGGTKFDLSLSLRPTRQAPHGAGQAGSVQEPDPAAVMDGTLEFDRDLFDLASARLLARRFVRLVEQATAAPDTPLRELTVLLPGEEAEQLALGTGPCPPEGGPETVVAHFARTAASRPDDLAVVAPDGRLTFAELDARADRLAALLTEEGVRPGEPVSVLLTRSADSLTALLAVLRARAVYAPLDPGLPPARLALLLDDTRPRTVVTTRETASRIPGEQARLLLDSAPVAAALAREAVRPGPPPGPADPAYLVHTSGSTGRPKGVLVGHGSLARLLGHHREHLFASAVRGTGERLKVALTASLSFDASWDPILWMCDGHELHLIDDLTRRDPEALVDRVRTAGLDVLETTPTYARQLLDAGLLAPHAPGPRVLALGGEAVPESLWRELGDGTGDLRCWNLYGPTEATVDTLTGPVGGGQPVLGSPVTGTRAYLLDTRLRPVPPGAVGDLHLAGDSLALGYLGRPGETARSFVPDPFGPPGARMYRTGDRARRTADGSLLFEGRADDQVKIRGFRVEPDEIATVVRKHPALVQAAVAVHEDGRLGTRLAAWVVPAQPGEAPGIASLRAHCAAHLPGHMVPTAWTVVESLPLTPSGKLDRAALPAPATPETGTGGRGPRNPREDVLCALFAEVLGLEQIGVDDDFFALGGHSLLATRLITRIRDALGVEVGIRALFEAPTVAALGARLLDGGEDNSLATLLPLRTKGELPPLFCVHPAGGLAWSYAGLLPHLDPDQPLYGLQTPNLDGEAPFPAGIEAMAAVYAQEIRTVQPHGPYRLLGWSFGGNVVQEVAVQLQEAGEEVALLAILDAFPLAPLDSLDSADRDTVFRALLSNLGVDEELLPEDTAVDATAVRDELRRLGSPLGGLEPPTIERMVDNFAGQARLMRAYTPRAFHGPLLFFNATEGRPADAFGTDLWAPYVTGPIDRHDVPCAHAQMMRPPGREQIGTTVAAQLRALLPTPSGEAS
ncbi:amino acid adenylation domain-containing protein [Streptomyces physcomitrii]|uniref:amino acid adenylation domain-containing protein n=1 Tax=Streptomyces physcomitrii TaxID=2724184 RepID=UPI003431E64E